ncbi:MAG: pseudouridine synthase [Gemmatimonadota bacterium]
MRLQRYLAHAGVASRRECERLIIEGRVSIDGSVVTELGSRVVPGEHVVRVDGRRVKLQPTRWIAMYKPVGYLSARVDDRGRPTVYSLLPKQLRHLFHVGRLDRLSEGLLLFTNDGEAANRLLHPRYGLARRYRLEVEGDFGKTEARRLQRGVRLEDGVARAEDVRVAAGTQPKRSGPAVPRIVHLTMREGRKREVRRMMDALGVRVKRLVRTAFGPIELAGIASGEWRDLSEEEIEAVKAAISSGEPGGST